MVTQRPALLPLRGGSSWKPGTTAQDSYGRMATDSVSVNLPATVRFTYDSNGNLTGDGRRVFEYDFENHLTNVYVASAWRSEFKYDAFGRRRVRREYGWQSSAWVLTNEVRYVYDGNLVIQERTASNLPTVTYTRGKDLSGMMEGAGGIGGLLARTDHSQASVRTHVLYHADGNGNIMALVATNGLLLGRYHYDPCGNVLTVNGQAAQANLYRFSSKEWHPNSGLVYYLYRFYDDSSQRWMNRDPLEDGASLVYGVNQFDSEEDLGLPSFQVEAVEGPNLYGFVANDPIGYWDGFGTSKGGKQNISCEGFTKRSCPDDVAKALEEAKKLKQLERAKKLRGLLKVIRRGGGMIIFFYIDFWLEVIKQSCPNGGGPVMANNENNTENMTSDGITTKEWDVVQDYAATIANAICADDVSTADAVSEKLLGYLDALETKYGRLPSILATRADYTESMPERLALLQEAYELAKQSGDRENLTLITSSLAQVYVEEIGDVPSAQKWLGLLADALGDKWDDLEHREFQSLTAQVETLRRQGRSCFGA